MNDVSHTMRATILLADDNHLLREVVAEILALEGYQVLQAPDGLAAIKTFREHHKKITHAVLDVLMPGCCGKEVADHISRLNPDLPIIFMTGYLGEHLLGNLKQTNITRVLYKPVQYELLIEVIEQSMENKPK